MYMRKLLLTSLSVLLVAPVKSCHACDSWGSGACGNGMDGAALAASHSGQSCTPQCPNEFCPESVRAGMRCATENHRTRLHAAAELPTRHDSTLASLSCSCTANFPPCPASPPAPPFAPPPIPPMIPPPIAPPSPPITPPPSPPLPPPEPPAVPLQAGATCERTSNCKTGLTCECKPSSFWAGHSPIRRRRKLFARSVGGRKRRVAAGKAASKPAAEAAHKASKASKAHNKRERKARHRDRGQELVDLGLEEIIPTAQPRGRRLASTSLSSSNSSISPKGRIPYAAPPPGGNVSASATAHAVKAGGRITGAGRSRRLLFGAAQNLVCLCSTRSF